MRTLQLISFFSWLRFRDVIVRRRSHRLLIAELKLNPDLHLSIHCCLHSSYSSSLCSRMWCVFTEITCPSTSEVVEYFLVFGWELKHINSSNESCLYFHNLMKGIHVNSSYIFFQRILNLKKILKFGSFFLYSSPPPYPQKTVNSLNRWLQFAAVVHSNSDKGGLWVYEHVLISSHIKRSCLNELMPRMTCCNTLTNLIP